MWNTADWREAEASEIIHNAAQKNIYLLEKLFLDKFMP